MADLTEAFNEAMAEAAEAPEVETTSEVDNPDVGITESESETTEEFTVEDIPEDSAMEAEDEGPSEGGEPNVLDWEAVADQLIPVKINGEEKLVPLKDFRDGIMMREDYSRKTAELAEARKFAEWAQDVQYALQSDPQGTIAAFAQAYGVQLGNPAKPAESGPEVDPYEDWDPDMAQMAKAFDAKLSQITEQYEAKIAQIEAQTGQITHERMVQEAQAEMKQLETQFTNAGVEFDPLSVLKIATENEIPLTQAAYLWAGNNAIANGKTKAEATAAAKKAADITAQAGETQRKQNKQRASSAVTKNYDASDVPTEQFETLTDLFKIEMARQG